MAHMLSPIGRSQLPSETIEVSRIVTLDSTLGKVSVCDAVDIPYGIAPWYPFDQEAKDAASGPFASYSAGTTGLQPITVYVGGVIPLVAKGAITRGAFVVPASDNSGKGSTAALGTGTQEWVIGRALNTVTTEGNIVMVEVNVESISTPA
jgi:hypothetical protein